jgi:hypothetical protein
MRCLPRQLLLADNENLREENAFFVTPIRDFFFKIIETQRRGISVKRSGKRNHRDQESRC